MTIFESLREDHGIQRQLVDKLVETQGDTAKRDDLFTQIRTELKCHSLAEERYFYAPLMEHDMTMKKSRHGVAEHHQLDKLIKQLEDTEYSSPGWLITAKQLADKVHHHLDEEEQEVFQLAGKVLSDNQKQDLAQSYSAEMETQRKQAS